MPATVRISYYGASPGEPVGFNAETGIVLSQSDAQVPAPGVAPVDIPLSIGTNFSWIMLLALQVTVGSTTHISNRKISFGTVPAVPAGSDIFWADQPTYRDPALGNKPPDIANPGPDTPAPTGAGAPAAYAAITTALQIFDVTSVATNAPGRNGDFVEIVGAVDNTYQGGPGQETFPSVIITYDEA